MRSRISAPCIFVIIGSFCVLKVLSMSTPRLGSAVVVEVVVDVVVEVVVVVTVVVVTGQI